MYYDLSSVYDNTFNVMKYTIKAMNESGFSKREIDEYIEEATNSDNNHLIDVSTDYISKCNDINHAYDSIFDDDFSNDTWYDQFKNYDDFYNYVNDDDFDEADLYRQNLNPINEY